MKTKSEMEILHELARAELAGTAKPKKQTELDPQVLAKLYPNEFAAMTETLRQAAALEKDAKDEGKLYDELIAATAAQKDHAEESKAIEKTRGEALRELCQKQLYANAIYSKAKKASQDLEVLHVDAPELFNLSPYDLDTFTLHCHESTIPASDPAAPALYVSAEIFDAETQRRRGLIRAANGKAAEDHASKWHAWTQKFMTVLRFKETPPPYDPPRLDWADVTAKP